MDLTPNLGLGKPLVGEDYDIEVHNTNSDILDAEVDDARDRILVLEQKFTQDPPPIINNAFVAVAGWSIVEQVLMLWGPIASVRFVVSRTGAQVSAGADGNITNLGLATWAAGTDRYKPLFAVGGSTANGGPMHGSFINTSNIGLNALLPGAPGNVETGAELYMSFMYFRDVGA